MTELLTEHPVAIDFSDWIKCGRLKVAGAPQTSRASPHVVRSQGASARHPPAQQPSTHHRPTLHST